MDWMQVSKAQFDNFRSSSECMWGIEKVIIPPSPKFNLPRPNNATVPKNVTSSTMVTSTSMTSLSSESQDDEDSASNVTELEYVLHSIFCDAVDGPLVKALDNHGLTTIQDVLLLNQAERDALHFPKADGTLSTLPAGYKNRFAIKLFGQYCEDEGKPIVNWKQVTRDEFNKFRSSNFDHAAEKSTVHPSFKADSTCIQTTIPTESMKVATDMKPSTSCVKEAESNAVLSSTTGICKHTISKSHVHHVVPVRKQQEILHDFLFRINQDTIGIPCGGKVCHPSSGMKDVSWPLEKSALLPRTLAQLACQDFKKEPLIALQLCQPSLPILHIFCSSSTLAVLLEHKFPFGQAMILAVYLLLLSL